MLLVIIIMTPIVHWRLTGWISFDTSPCTLSHQTPSVRSTVDVVCVLLRKRVDWTRANRGKDRVHLSNIDQIRPSVRPSGAWTTRFRFVSVAAVRRIKSSSVVNFLNKIFIVITRNEYSTFSTGIYLLNRSLRSSLIVYRLMDAGWRRGRHETTDTGAADDRLKIIGTR